MGYPEIVSGVKWICDYLEIPNYLLVKYKSITEGEKIYESEEEFWAHLLGAIFHDRRIKKQELHEGDIVVLKSFQLSPWISRLPGLYWTQDWQQLKKIAQQHQKDNHCLNLHYEPWVKSLLVNGGLGSIRLDTHDGMTIYGATSSGTIDASIPIICKEKVAAKLNNEFRNNKSLEVNIRGTIRRIPYTYQFYSPNIPRYCIHVDTVFDVKTFTSDFTISGNAWVVYRNPKEDFEKACGYCYAPFNPIDETSLIESTNWILNFIDHYTKGAGFPVTDFDELTPRFKKSIVPIRTLMSDEVDYSHLNSLFKRIDYRDQFQQDGW